MSSRVVSFSGKGGVGKSTLLILLLKYLKETEKYKDILIIDADPDANVGDLIGKDVSFGETVGGKMSELKKKIQRREFPPNMPKTSLIESEIFSSLIEMEEFDILEMGRSEGEGCYCSVNNVIKNVIDILSKNYDMTLVDSPAGLEHFARKMGRNVEDLFIVTDASKMGIHTIKRIIEITKEVELNFKNIYIIGNRFSEDLKDILVREVNKFNDKRVKFLGLIPNDDKISEINISGNSLLSLPSDNPAYLKAKELFSGII
ncbi:MAG: AAA family ATPase [Promethearchaeota archaeon]